LVAILIATAARPVAMAFLSVTDIAEVIGRTATVTKIIPQRRGSGFGSPVKTACITGKTAEAICLFAWRREKIL
jgi:hypothetical protein